MQQLGTIDPAVQLPTTEEVQQIEHQLDVVFPPTYRTFLLEYSNISFGTFEMLRVNPSEEDSYLSIQNVVADARRYYHLPESLLPFLEDNGDYYCFNLESHAPECQVVYWSHDGLTNEKWLNFLDWVEKCWIDEYSRRVNL